VSTCVTKWKAPIVALQSNNQSGFGRQRRKFVLLSASHSTRVSTFTTAISGPVLNRCFPFNDTSRHKHRSIFLNEYFGRKSTGQWRRGRSFL